MNKRVLWYVFHPDFDSSSGNKTLLQATEGIENITTTHPDVDIYTAVIDDRLNENGYILPGLGDAGDKIFGTKN